jgi:hypothetical protein
MRLLDESALVRALWQPIGGWNTFDRLGAR